MTNQRLLMINMLLKKIYDLGVSSWTGIFSHKKKVYSENPFSLDKLIESSVFDIPYSITAP